MRGGLTGGDLVTNIKINTFNLCISFSFLSVLFSLSSRGVFIFFWLNQVPTQRRSNIHVHSRVYRVSGFLLFFIIAFLLFRDCRRNGALYSNLYLSACLPVSASRQVTLHIPFFTPLFFSPLFNSTAHSFPPPNFSPGRLVSIPCFFKTCRLLNFPSYPVLSLSFFPPLSSSHSSCLLHLVLPLPLSLTPSSLSFAFVFIVISFLLSLLFFSLTLLSYILG